MTKRPNPDRQVLQIFLSQQGRPPQARPAQLQPVRLQPTRLQPARRQALTAAARGWRSWAVLAPGLFGALLLGTLLMGATGCGGNSASSVANATDAKDQISFGVEMARRQLWNEALFRFEQAARMDPNNPRVYNNLAVACEATGQFDKALEYYKEALRREPGNQDLKKNYARFVEFYRGFAPADEDGSGAGGGE